jgi:glycosyltransferase involved in cell wall biosynthesis
MLRNGKLDNRPLRIAQVAPLIESVPPSGYGGTERVVSWLTEELVAMGHRVTLFASGDSMTAAELVAPWPRSLRLDANSVDKLAHHVLMLELVFRERDRFDLVHFHIDYLHFPLSRLHRQTQLTTLHGRLDIPDLQPIYREFPDMPVVSISDAQRRPIPSAHWVGTVYHGLPTDLHTFGPGDGGYLAFLGRISPEKGVDRAMSIARRCGMPLKIAAKVDNADRDYFRHTVQPLLDDAGRAVEFIGEVGGTAKNEFLGRAAAVLFPIDWPEPFGLVMIEAMACGTPVIAYPRGSVPEVLEDGVTGFIVKNEDEAVAAVGRLDELSRTRCRREFENRYNARRMAEDYVRLYRRLLAGHTEVDTPIKAAEDVEQLLPGRVRLNNA